MTRRTSWLMAPLAVAALMLAITACGGGGEESAAAEKEPSERTIYMSAVEWKGSASLDKEPYPGPVPEGGGYESFPPGHEEVDGDPNTWAIETYRFDTAVVTAYAGERVTLKIFGVNSAHHDIVIPDFNQEFTVKRGVVTEVSFVVKEPGIYKIVCITHPPSHQADLVVLPRS